MPFCKSASIGFLLVLLITRCSATKESEFSGPLFHPIEASGIDFINKLEPTVDFSAFDYVYYQNGGGVAIADLDLDGYEDIIFTSNLGQDRIYRNIGNLSFEDITATSGLLNDKNSLVSWSTGVTITDVNADGYPDIYICKSGNHKRGKITENLLYVNQQDLTFIESGAAYNLNDPNASTQASFFDYDKDGDLDVFVLNHSPQFGDPAHAHRLDQFKQAVRPHSCSFYINEAGRYREASAELGLAGFSYGLGVVTSDIDGDGWTDIYVAQDFSIPDKIYYNTGEGTFVEELKQSMGHVSQFSMGCDIADIDNDGLLDISVVDMAPASNYRSKTMMPSMSTEDFRTYVNEYDYTPQYMYNSLQLNRGKRTFSEIAKLNNMHKTDWSWSTLLADFDNDGDKDQVVTNGYKFNRMENDFALAFDSMMRSHERNPPLAVRKQWITSPPSYKLQNKAFKNQGNLSFVDISDEWGFAEKSFSNGAAYADLDKDGDLDLVINNIDDPAYVLENRSQSHYLQVEIQRNGKPDLASALNTRIQLYLNETQQVSELTLSRGFQSSSTSIVHFGIGDASSIDSMLIYIPTIGTIKRTRIKANQRIIIDLDKLKDKDLCNPRVPEEEQTIFSLKKDSLPLFVHRENHYDDFEKELLLPHQNSRSGPFISVADVNSDGLEDFYIGAAAGQSAALFLQSETGLFDVCSPEVWAADSAHEDMQSCFIDIDNDGDLDLYVVSGGNEWPEGDQHYKDRFYLNTGNGVFRPSLESIPIIRSSGAAVTAIDINQDGLQDLFIGGKMAAQRYPYPSSSHLLLNEAGIMRDITSSSASLLDSIGIVNDAMAADIDGDGQDELLVVGEWMHPLILKFENEQLIDISPAQLKNETGWWNTVLASDLDQDGDVDFIAGNLGLNYKYKASKEEPFTIFANDFDSNGNLDIVLAYHSEGKQYPVRGRECSSNEIPTLLERFPTYHAFASSSLVDIYGDNLQSGIHLDAEEFASCIFVNEGKEGFRKVLLPVEAQFSSINGIELFDYDQNGTVDMLVTGNLYSSEIETPRNDASLGCLLSGDGKGNFEFVPSLQSGLFLRADTKDIELIQIGDQPYILFGNNDGALELLKVNGAVR
jgi:hypothetical protein